MCVLLAHWIPPPSLPSVLLGVGKILVSLTFQQRAWTILTIRPICLFQYVAYATLVRGIQVKHLCISLNVDLMGEEGFDTKFTGLLWLFLKTETSIQKSSHITPLIILYSHTAYMYNLSLVIHYLHTSQPKVLHYSKVQFYLRWLGRSKLRGGHMDGIFYCIVVSYITLNNSEYVISPDHLHLLLQRQRNWSCWRGFNEAQ